MRFFSCSLAVIFALILTLCVGCKSQKLDGSDVIELPVTVNSTERPLKFKSADGFELEGTLCVPAGYIDTDHPGVLLISGSGPTDRDGNQTGLKTDTLKQIANALAATGVVSFRFDKRAVGKYAAKWPKKIDQYGEFFSWNHHIEDALAAYRAMLETGLVEPEHGSILGHSEGGIIALAIASRARPAAVMLIATPGRPFDVLIKEQLSSKLKGTGLGEKLLAENDRISAQIKKTGKVPANVPQSLKALYNPSIGLYYQQISRVQPVALAKTLTMPVLVLNGELDIQVNPQRDAKLLFGAANKRGKADLVLIPLASHNLKPVESDSILSGFSGEIVPDAIEAIQEFVVKHLGGKMPEGQTNVN